LSEASVFAGQTVVITGAARGLGLGMARRFGRSAALVVIADVDGEAGSHAAAALVGEGLSVEFKALDVRNPHESEALVEDVIGRHGAIEVWVNNAGVAHKGPAETLSREAWDDSLAVMLSGAFYCAQAVGKHMLARGRGVVVNVASVNAFQAIEGRVAYSAAKAGLVMLTAALGVEWAGRGVRVVGLAPGVVMTDMVEQGVRAGLASMNDYTQRTPMRRLGRVEEIAEAVMFLASSEASFITGETMRVDGGWGAYQLF
jgi:3-oxoacyl-[acyl-carrier protein] reductase